jgi:hypothetical protein
VLRGSGRVKQFVRMRDKREEAMQLAFRDNDRVRAERAAACNRRRAPYRTVRH